MDPARYQRVRALLHAAAEKAPGDRDAFLEREAGGDLALAAEVRSLLLAEEVATRHVVPADVLAGLPVPLSAGTVLGAWRIEREIGRGGMGVVYEAVAEAGGERVALKVILPHLLALPAARERFLREARLGLAVEHENLVRTRALSEANVGDVRFHFLVMDLVRGRTLRALLAEEGPVPEALWREIARQAARGLEALHEAGVVHRDLKPENLLLSDDRRLRIMDLGIAKVALAGTALTSEGQFIGSLKYAAPEQAAGRDVGPAADLYSLGVVLHEIAAGTPPFEATDPVALLRAHADAGPTPLSQRAPAYSDFASDVVATLLAKEPADRFPSAKALRAALEEGEAGAWYAARPRRARRARAGSRAGSGSLRLVARERERGALLHAWREARAGRGRAALLVGEAGIGKTRLADDLVAAVHAEDAIVLRSDLAGADHGGHLPTALAEALGPSVEEGIARLLGLSGPVAADFAAVLRPRTPLAGASTLGAAAVEGLSLRLVRALSAETPVLWVVEDAHEAGPDARRLLVALARGIAGARILLLVTARPSLDPAAASALALAPDSLRVDLPRLDTAGVAALAGEALADAPLGDHLSGFLSRRADGVPLFVLEILRDLERRAILVRRDDGSFEEAGLPDEAGAPPALADLVRARLAPLDSVERAVLDTAAIVGPEFDPCIVAAVRGLQSLEVLDVVGRLERRDRLLSSGPSLCRFDHALVRDVLLADLSPALAAELHERTADAIEAGARAGAEGSARAAVVAAHRLRGPNPARALPMVVPAVLACERAGRFGDAYDLARRALAVPGASAEGERADLAVLAARLSRTLGRAAETVGLLDEAAAAVVRLGDPLRAARVRLQRAEHGLVLGRFEEALADARAARDAFRAAGSDSAVVVAMGFEGQALWCLGRLEEAREVQAAALEAAADLGSSVEIARAASNLGVALHEMGRLAEAEIHLRAALDVTRQMGDRLNLGVVTNNLGNVLFDAGRKAEALACYEATVEADRATGQRPGEAVAWVNIGEVRLRLGDLAGARTAYRLSETLAREAATPRVEAYALHGLGALAAAEGNGAEARRRLREALAIRRRIGHRPGTAETCLALGAIEQESGTSEEARPLLSEALSTAEAVGDPGTAALARIRLSLLSGGDLEEARRSFEEVQRRVRHDARLEARYLLWKRTGSASDLAAAKRLLDEQRRHAPASARASMLERVAMLREIADALP